jgi:predicted phosphodiesterase
MRLPETAVVEVVGRLLFVLHDVGDLAIDPVGSGYSAVIFGHSHKPIIERRDDVLYLNPGSAGPRRFHLPVAIAHMRVSQSQMSAEVVPLRV